MKLKQFIVIPIMIAVLAALLQVLDQLLSPYVLPEGNKGFGWIAFQSWAMYFLAGCTVKGGFKTLVGYASGIFFSILIMMFGGYLSGAAGFWAFPISLLVIVTVVIMQEKVKILDFIPAVFIGAGAFFAFMSYVPNATFGGAALTELIYCTIGLSFGYVTVLLRGKYEAAINKDKK